MKALLIATAVLVIGAAIGLFVLLRGDSAETPLPPTPFEGRLGENLVACNDVCTAEATCARPGFTHDQCIADCQAIVQIKTVKPTCAAAFTRGLSCYWHLANRCGPEDGCAAEWAAAYDCVCALPDLPIVMQARCRS